MGREWRGAAVRVGATQPNAAASGRVDCATLVDTRDTLAATGPSRVALLHDLADSADKLVNSSE